MLELLASATVLIAQSVGPGFVGVPGTPFVVCLNDPSTSVNIRTGPSTRNKSMGRLRHGQGLFIIDRIVSNSDGMWWAKVRTSNGQVGFVRDDYVCGR